MNTYRQRHTWWDTLSMNHLSTAISQVYLHIYTYDHMLCRWITFPEQSHKSHLHIYTHDHMLCRWITFPGPSHRSHLPMSPPRSSTLRPWLPAQLSLRRGPTDQIRHIALCGTPPLPSAYQPPPSAAMRCPSTRSNLVISAAATRNIHSILLEYHVNPSRYAFHMVFQEMEFSSTCSPYPAQSRVAARAGFGDEWEKTHLSRNTMWNAFSPMLPHLFCPNKLICNNNKATRSPEISREQVQKLTPPFLLYIYWI